MSPLTVSGRTAPGKADVAAARPAAIASSRPQRHLPHIQAPQPPAARRSAAHRASYPARATAPSSGRGCLRYKDMKQVTALLATLALTSAAALAAAPKSQHSGTPPESGAGPASVFSPRAVKSTGTVTVEGHKIAYQAVAGTIIVHPKGWDEAAKPDPKNAIGTADGPPVASMFYVAYFKQGVDPRTRPVTFLYNGGPGSSTIWL